VVDAAQQRKIKSGIYGLNTMLYGGLNKHSATVVIGPSGAGKTTLATQFLRRGLADGQEGIYITLDEPPEQIIEEAQQMGFEDLTHALEREQIIFIDASGKQFREFILKELQGFVSSWGSSDARIVIDPLTPVLWATPTKYEQRELLSFLFKQGKRIGTVLATLEEHGDAGQLSSAETAIPMYLADNILHLRMEVEGHMVSRTMRVLKTRASRHSHRIAPYEIRRGLGVVVEPQPRPHGAKAGPAEGETPAQWRAGIARHLEARGLPEASRARVRQLVDALEAEPILGLSPEQLIDLVLEDSAKAP
jgi:KaiC/GvpD/RAD55 family RecA-like ATPase